MFWKWRKAGKIGREEAVRVHLIRFIADNVKVWFYNIELISKKYIYITR